MRAVCVANGAGKCAAKKRRARWRCSSARERRIRWQVRGVVLAAAIGLCLLASVGGLIGTDIEGSDPIDTVQGTAWNAGRRLLFDKLPGTASPKALHLFEENTTPSEVLSEDELKNGGFVLHLIGCLYVFLGLAIVCDEYFVPALDVLVEVSGVNDDVAGATFMAAGGSAPELFTSLIGTFMESSVGFGTIVGSAVFNILFVIGMCALKSNEVIQLTWWPLLRDMSYYLLSILILAIVFGVNSKSEIEWWEALLLFSLYIGYCFLMKNNQFLQNMVENAVGFTSGKGKTNDLEKGDNKEPKGSTVDVISLIRGTKTSAYGGKDTITSIYHVGILKAISNHSDQAVWFKEKEEARASAARASAARASAAALKYESENGDAKVSEAVKMANTNLKIVNRMKYRIEKGARKILGVEDFSNAELDANAISELLKELGEQDQLAFAISEDEAKKVIEGEAKGEKFTMDVFNDWFPDSSFGKELLCECTFREVDANKNGLIGEKEIESFLKGAQFEEGKVVNGGDASSSSWKGMKVEVAQAWWQSEKKKEAKRRSMINAKGSSTNGQGVHLAPNYPQPIIEEGGEAGVNPPEQVEKTIVEWFKNSEAGVDYAQFREWYFSKMYKYHKLALSPRRGKADPFSFGDGDIGNITAKDESEDSEDNGPNLMDWPARGSVKDKLVFLLIAPHVYLLHYSIPDCKVEEYKKYYPVAFTMSIVWIGIYSYLMVWWTTTIGDTLGIPDEIMGLTFLAAGTSIPDLMTSVIVAMEGKGDMALSSSIGSNIFDILVGLPIPWLLYSAVKMKSVNVAADTLFGSLLVLFIMIACVLTLIKFYKFRLEKGLGHGMLVLYVVFLLQDIFRNPKVSPFY